MDRPTFPPRLVLYYSPKACSLASHIALEESGLPYEAVAINIRDNAHRSPEYLAINPGGTVPALGIDDAVLTESQAILTYVADLVPDRELIPRTGTLARGRAHQWMNLVSSTMHVAYRSVFRPQAYSGESGVASEAVRGQGFVNLVKVLTSIDERLAGQRHVLGDAFTVVDAYLFVFYLWRFDERLVGDVPDLPHYRALAERVWRRPAVRVAVERERAVRAYAMPPGMSPV